MAQEKETCALVLVGRFWLFNLENTVDMIQEGVVSRCFFMFKFDKDFLWEVDAWHIDTID